MSLILADTVLLLVTKLAIPGDFLRPDIEYVSIFQTAIFIRPLCCIRCQSGPLTHSALRQFSQVRVKLLLSRMLCAKQPTYHNYFVMMQKQHVILFRIEWEICWWMYHFATINCFWEMKTWVMLISRKNGISHLITWSNIDLWRKKTRHQSRVLIEGMNPCSSVSPETLS